MTTATLTRDITLEVAHNVRHIGGYRTRGGRITSPAFIRAGGLQNLTAGSLEAIRSMGIRTVVDFRSAPERDEHATPDLAPYALRHVVAPVFESDGSPAGLATNFPGYPTVYRSFLETGRDAYRTLAETIAESNGGLLFHCAVGKDRTGVAAALLLDLAGVPQEVIIEDYAHSERNLRPMLPKWKEGMAARGLDVSRAEELMASHPADMGDLLGHLTRTWGSAAGYFASIGVAPATLRAVRERLLSA